jgi:hypothetical protein
MNKEERLMKVELEYMEKFERDEAPSLEDLVEYYPELREELIEFVLDFLSLEGVASRTKLSEEGARRTEAAFERATDKVLKQVGSFEELRIVADESLLTLAQAIHLPLSVLDGLERGMIVLDSIPAKLFERLAEVLSRPSSQIRALLQNQGLHTQSIHRRALATRSGKKQKVSFGEALRKSEDFGEEYRRDWFSDVGQED